MTGFIGRHQTPLLLVSLITISIYLMSLDMRNPEKTLIIEKGIMAIIGPFQSASVGVYGFFSNAIDDYINLVNTNRDNKRLRRRVSRLEAQNTSLIEEQIQNKRLRRIVNLEESMRYDLLVCSVIGVDPSRFFSSVFIDRGSRDGVSINMPVTTYSGIAGKVIKVSARTARVQLLTDARSSIAVLVQRSRAAGILQGNGSNICEMVYIDAEADLKPGDTVISSGFGGIFPKGLRVGKVRSVVKKKGALTKSCSISTFINVLHLEEVFVLMAERKDELEALKRENW
ncbi:rod shape-determining protein MreC [bacterium]|nr:rod shape-determining protein MreC [bacterium]